jgi:putative component of toxin-antitoxin plasmid stabilization module
MGPLPQTESGKCPFDDWFGKLRDKRTEAIVDTKLIRLRLGNFGFCLSVRKGVSSNASQG